MRGAAAAARTLLLTLASAQLGVPVASLSVANGVVSGGGKSVTYAGLAAGKAFRQHDRGGKGNADRPRELQGDRTRVPGSTSPTSSPGS
jgi:hypothetical protein